MTDVNPYASPAGQATAATDRGRIRGAGAWVLMHFGFSAWQIYANWWTLTWADYLGIVPLWFALPLAALYLVWRGRSLGRWILIGLFGLRAAGCSVILATHFAHGLRHLQTLVTPPVLANIIQISAYGAATGWLVCARAMRRRPTSARENNA